MKTITVESLRAMDACADQVDLFAKTLPGGMELTRANLLHAANAFLDVDWWVCHSKECKPHWRAYMAAREQHRQAYEAAGANTIADLLGLP